MLESKQRLLIVGDSERLRKYENMFPQFLVEQIASVPQAIRYIRREKPDLVLTDEQTKGKLLQGNVDFYRILELDDSVQPGKIRESIEKADEFEIVKNDMASKLPQIDREMAQYGLQWDRKAPRDMKSPQKGPFRPFGAFSRHLPKSQKNVCWGISSLR
jgi:hypothetical protein